jgi:hypothetical protein
MLRSHWLERLIIRARAARVQTENRGFVMKTSTGKRMLTMLLCLAGLVGFVAPKARADEDKDPPTRVARISFVDGSVSLQPGGQGDWGSAARNRPMTIGDKIWADKDSRAELQAGAVSIHLGSMTALSFLNLDEGITQMRLAEGSVNFRVSELRQGDTVEVDAPNLAFLVKQAGAFRIDVDESGDSARVTVIRGEGEVTVGGKTYPVHAGERAEFTGTDNIQSNIEKAPDPDGLDRWAAQRDLKEDNSVSGNYVSRETPGYSDLDDNGTWQDEPEYGHVWYPNEVAPGWAPYSDGYWNYVGPWGWTWVGYEPWGFAPYHYGRWNYFGGRWGWCPGPFLGPPVYGPAFVGFFGGGFGFGVGWFPLGFGEPFFPWFHCRHEFFERINVHNTFIRNRNVFNTNVRNVNFVNAHNVNAVTVANRNAFMNGQAINRGATHLTAASLKGAQVTNSAGVNPTHQSSLGSANLKPNVARPSAAVQNRTVIARTAPAQGASQTHVHTVNSARLTSGRAGNAPANSATNQRPGSQNGPSRNAPATTGRSANMPNTSSTPSRQEQLAQSRPPAAGNGNSASQRAGQSSRSWEAQGNTTDRGHAPAGFGNSNRPANAPAQTARVNDANRPPWAREGGQSSVSNGQSTRPSAPSNNANRAPQQMQRDTPAYNGNRGSSQPRSYSPPPSRSYSAPRTYSAPSRSYPAPSHSSPSPSRGSSGGGGSHSGGGGSPHGGGGSGSHGRH